MTRRAPSPRTRAIQVERDRREAEAGPTSPLAVMCHLRRLAESEEFKAQPAVVQTLTAAAEYVSQHLPINREALAKAAQSDEAIRALVQRAGLRITKPVDLAKVRALLRAAGEGA